MIMTHLKKLFSFDPDLFCHRETVVTFHKTTSNDRVLIKFLPAQTQCERMWKYKFQRKADIEWKMQSNSGVFSQCKYNDCNKFNAAVI